jgi:hypothetical protein
MRVGVKFLRSERSETLCAALWYVWEECGYNFKANASSSGGTSFNIVEWGCKIRRDDWFSMLVIDSVGGCSSNDFRLAEENISWRIDCRWVEQEREGEDEDEDIAVNEMILGYHFHVIGFN